MATEKQSKKLWVFKKLVKSEDDFVGLIAYGLYKRRKTEIADGLRRNKVDESQITSRLDAFHEQEVQGRDALKIYRDRAERLLDGLLKSTYAAAKKDAIECVLMEAARQQEVRKWYWRGLSWLVSGVPSALATVVIAVIVLGSMALLSGTSVKGDLASSLVNRFVGEEIVKPANSK